MTLLLAIWGAAVATLVGVAEIVSFFRDRPKIDVGVALHVRADQPPVLVLKVANHGRQPVTIVKAAFVVAVEAYTVTNETKGTAPVTGLRPEIPVLGEGALLIPPGELRQLPWVIDRWPNMIHADFPLRAYVVDSRSRTTWGPAAAWLRMILNSGVPTPADAKTELVTPAPDMRPLIPEPVAKRWELWKPRAFRKPELPPPHSKQWPRPERTSRV